MNTLISQVQELQLLARELLCLGDGGTPIYTDHFRQLNKEILCLSDSLFSKKCASLEEEGQLCIALLMAYNATIYDSGDKEGKKQILLNRAFAIFELLSVSLLKCQLLTYCYGEVFDEELAKEAHEIIDGWNGREYSMEELEVMGVLQILEENQYPFVCLKD